MTVDGGRVPGSAGQRWTPSSSPPFGWAHPLAVPPGNGSWGQPHQPASPPRPGSGWPDGPREPGATAPDGSTYNPILGRVEARYYKLGTARRLRSRAGVAQVLFRHGAIVRVVPPHHDLSSGEIAASRCTHAVHVDVLPHDLVLQGPLPCRGGAHNFDAVVRLTCRVVQPDKVVEENVVDVGERLKRAVFDQMWRVSHDHGVNDDIRARQAILEQLPWDRLDSLFELSKISLDLRLDDGVREILRAELNRGYFEDLVNKGPTAVAAWHLNRHQDDASGAMDLLHEHQRRQVEIHREEERHLLDNNVVRREVLEARALERLDRLEPQELRPPGAPNLPRLPHTAIREFVHDTHPRAIEGEVVEMVEPEERGDDTPAAPDSYR
jgi:hypothetical protein